MGSTKLPKRLPLLYLSFVELIGVTKPIEFRSRRFGYLASPFAGQ